MVAAHQLTDWQAWGVGGNTPHDYSMRPGSLEGRPGVIYPSGEGKRERIAFTDGKKPKYKWMPSNDPLADYYTLPGNMGFQLAENEGFLIVANGEKAVWVLDSVGIYNTVSLFGESSKITTLIEAINQWQIETVVLYPDIDDAGGNAARSWYGWRDELNAELEICDMAAYLENEHRLLNCEGWDLRDVLEQVANGDGSKMREIMENMRNHSMVISAAPETPVLLHTDGAELHDQWVSEIVKPALHLPSNPKKHIHCPNPAHADKNPSFRVGEQNVPQCTCNPQNWHEVASWLNLESYEDWKLSRRKPVGEVQRDPTAQTESSEDEKKPALYIQLGDQLIKRWKGDLRYFRESWHEYKNGVWKIINTKVVNDRVYRHIKRTKANVQAKGIRDYLEAVLYTQDEDIDQGDNYVPLANGLFNLTTCELEPHKRELYITSQLPFEYKPNATCKRWIQFLREQLVTPDGETDMELVDLMQEAFGYTMTASTRLQASFWLHGIERSGKSTTLEVLQHLLGDACIQLDLGMLDKNTYQLAMLPGKRAATCSENPAGSYLADSVFKQLVSGDMMQARQIRKEPIQFKPTAKLWWAMNEAPHIKDRSGATYRRMQVIPFNRSVPKGQVDRRLIDKLTAELPGIFNWSIAGLLRLREQGDFTEAQQAIDAVDAIRDENDTEAAFIADTCNTGRGYEEKSSNLYAGYKLWCSENGYRPKAARRVARDWERLGFTKEAREDANYWVNVGLDTDWHKRVLFQKEGESVEK